jgi:hypothetical protein
MDAVSPNRVMASSSASGQVVSSSASVIDIRSDTRSGRSPPGRVGTRMRHDFRLMGRRSGCHAHDIPRIEIGAWWNAGAPWKGIQRRSLSRRGSVTPPSPAARQPSLPWS